MKLNLGFGHSATLLALLGLTAMGASAQTVLKGTFDLPGQAYWNNTMLPAGEYNLSVSKDPTGVGVISVWGEGVKASFIAPAGLREDASGSNCLRVENVNGAYVIRELDSSVLNRSYKFGVSKAARRTVLSGEAGSAVTVPVSPASGF
ncbi:MAG: hypothetical protein ABSH50_22435 [Bryobacteraceae bacterium]